MKTLLTGVAGTGKSTITKGLCEREIAAIDLHDVPDLFVWRDKSTGNIIPYSPAHSKGWFDTVDRLCDIEKLEKMLNQHEDTVMTGTTSGSNQREFLSLFDRIILLQCDPRTIVHRMQTRTNKSGYGKTKEEQEDNLAWQKEYDPLLLSYGAIPVSTAGSLDDTVDRIVRVLRA